MKFLIVIVILGLAAADTEACVREKCADLVTKCTNSIGCALAAYTCDSKCKTSSGKSDPACNVDCVNKQSNTLLKQLNQCGIDNCSNVPDNLMSVSACAKDLNTACPLEASVKSMLCVAKFFYTRPDCTQ